MYIHVIDLPCICWMLSYFNVVIKQTPSVPIKFVFKALQYYNGLNSSFIAWMKMRFILQMWMVGLPEATGLWVAKKNQNKAWDFVWMQAVSRPLLVTSLPFLCLEVWPAVIGTCCPQYYWGSVKWPETCKVFSFQISLINSPAYLFSFGAVWAVSWAST